MKPVIPNDVADGIEELRANGWTNGDIAGQILAIPVPLNLPLKLRIIRGYFAGVDGAGIDDFLAALVNGYEREKTPEQIAEEDRAARHELLRRVYTDRNRIGSEHNNEFARCFVDGILFAVQTLGIEIEGVNV